jgi:hypothetical protein
LTPQEAVEIKACIEHLKKLEAEANADAQILR